MHRQARPTAELIHHLEARKMQPFSSPRSSITHAEPVLTGGVFGQAAAGE